MSEINQRPGGFSVLMAVYSKDDEALFERAIQSVYENTLTPDEFILVVDGPVPAPLRSKIENMERLYLIRTLWLPENVGLAVALNRGLELVKTEWVARADADDYNLPSRFEMQLKLARKGFDLIGSAIEEVDESGQIFGVRATPLVQAEIETFARYRNPFNHMTVVFRTSLAKECGGYPDIYLKEDYALWALMIKNGARIANTSEVLVKATAGRDMYKRRGGLRYAKAEIDLQLHLVSCGIKGEFSAFCHGIMRSVVFLLPPDIRGFIYEKFLRKNQQI